jgi:cytochrome bd-type quinol oxidase subunit 2
MLPLLAYADTTDTTQMNLPMVLYCLGGVIVAGILAFLVILLARSRQHRQAETLITAAIFWAVCLIASVAWATVTQLKWSQEYTLRLQTGDVDPTDLSDAPQLPWLIWIILGVVYVLLILWARSQKPPEDQPQN